MTTVGRDIASVELTDPELWLDGPPHEAFKQMRRGCPIHWTESFELFPEEPGFWSVTTAEDVHTVSRDWQTYSSERGGVLVAAAGFPLELAQAMFIGMDPPQARPTEGAVPGRLHAEADRRPRGCDPGRSRSGCSTVCKIHPPGRRAISSATSPSRWSRG